jgi:hypothetical protein
MNTHGAPGTPARADFVFRTADRMRIDGCANAIAREGLSLSLQCEHEALLDHYLSLLIHRLRQEAPEHSIEAYFPSNTDSLLGRFNEALAHQSVEQATRSPDSTSRAQIWIVHDAQALPESEIQLLARLIQNFPGANIRAILLKSGPNTSHNNLAAFGRKILRWDIELPSQEQAQAALDIARTEGRLQPVQQLLKRIQRQHWSEDPTENLDNTLATVLPNTETTPVKASWSAKEMLQACHAKGRQAITQFTKQLATRGRSNLIIFIWVILALSLSTAIMLWLQPEAFGIGQPKTATQAMPLPIEWPEPTPPGNMPSSEPPVTPSAPNEPNELSAPNAPSAPNTLP